jgi:hypothetical protein
MPVLNTFGVKEPLNYANVTTTAPVPKNTKRKVPNISATNFFPNGIIFYPLNRYKNNYVNINYY